ncbi:ThuA domain-containing protein [Aquirufa salirivi]|uniref:ThuA domain-containing protein n=1 Tax=Aquirufa salirivi TaxID=3104729 RepID=A0ABW8RUV5_9BACT
MKNNFFGSGRIFASICLACLFSFSLVAQDKNVLKGKKVLVFSSTKGFRHSSIEPGKIAFLKMAAEKGFSVDTTENAAAFTENNLMKYRVVVFLNTTGNVLTAPQQNAFERYIQAGGGYLGIHAATDTEYDWPWYGKLSGGYFASHPGRPNVQEGKMNVVDGSHISTSHMPASFNRKDEFYDIKEFNKDVKVLVTVDEKSYKDGKMGDFHPMAWYHEFDGGRAFYTNWGHTHESFSEDLVLKHIWGGLQWVASGADINYNKKLRTGVLPEENRFTKITLDRNLDEPTELAVTNQGKIFYAERKGKLKMFDPKKGKTKVVANLDVFNKFEYGLMGMNIDPNYDQNKWIYLFYSPQTGQADTAQHLSRFTYDDVKDTLLMNTEKVLLRVPVKRTGCCHTGGSIAWDKEGNLFLSTGDDTNPFESNGFGPIDNRPGRAGWDARSTSSNTNDLRGKIMRIKPTADGSYTIPKGNLFPEKTPHAKAEIYVMGNRNPYRIAVDQRTGFLYWGEVGPDAGENSPKYGSRGYDEVNQAREAGYFGWPLFVGNNQSYNQRDFVKDSTWAKFSVEAPINNSPHNTGFSHLPKPQKAFIFYPYVDSPDFGPVIGKGSRNAMAGPVYYSEDFPANSKTKFPAYYDGKLFAYDWARDIIYTVSMKQNGDFDSMERFLPSLKFSHPIDMQFANDGTFYGLEYGPNWFAQNEEATLYKIEYNGGNRPPKVEIAVDKKVGASPLKVKFSSAGTLDYDGDAIKYAWSFGDGQTSTLANPSITYTKSGVFKAVLKVKDAKGNVSSAETIVKVGNEIPKVDVSIEGNKSFYWNDKAVKYQVKVEDKEDGTLSSKKIAEEDVVLNINYLQGFDKTLIEQGHQSNTSFSNGKRLIELSDCKTCHAVEKKSIGPSYTEVGKKYRATAANIDMLAKKVISGGGGVWGEQVMAAHPQIKSDDAKEMVRFILSLSDTKKTSKPLKGEYVTNDGGKPGTFLFVASYTDKGGSKVGSATGQQVITLRNSRVAAATADQTSKTMKYKIDGIGELLVATADKGYANFGMIDLTGIKSIQVSSFVMPGQTAGGKLELRSGSPSGTLLGSIDINTTGEAKMPVNVSGTQNLYFVFSNPNAGDKPLYGLKEIYFEN